MGVSLFIVEVSEIYGDRELGLIIFAFLFLKYYIIVLSCQNHLAIFAMFENYQCRGFLSVLGAFMIAMAIGLMYLWGIIAIYATSYFRIVMNNLTLNE